MDRDVPESGEGKGMAFLFLTSQEQKGGQSVLVHTVLRRKGKVS